METVVFLLIWFGAVPLAASAVADDIAREEIFADFLAWLDGNFRGTKLAYLVRCPKCLAHWVIFFVAAGFWKCWWDLPLPDYCKPAAIAACVFAAIRLSNFFFSE